MKIAIVDLPQCLSLQKKLQKFSSLLKEICTII